MWTRGVRHELGYEKVQTDLGAGRPGDLSTAAVDQASTEPGEDMKIRASVKNTKETHHVVVSTNDNQTALEITPKLKGRGSSINGGELLFLSLATCYCNDIFREAERMEIVVHELEVDVHGEFGGRGEPAKNVSFDVKISADAGEDKIKELLHLTDTVAEIQNTMRIAVPVMLRHTEIL